MDPAEIHMLDQVYAQSCTDWKSLKEAAEDIVPEALAGGQEKAQVWAGIAAMLEQQYSHMGLAGALAAALTEKAS